MNPEESDLAWHSATAAAAAAALDVDPTLGLAPDEVQRRLAAHGPNRLPEKRAVSAWRHFASQFASVLVGVLAVAAVVAWAIGEVFDAVVILSVLGVNAVLGFVQERRADRAAAALQKMLTTRCRVLREGQMRRLEIAELVPGDVVHLEAGDRVPADGRLAAAHGLEVDESTLTGESEPVTKRADVVLEAGTPAADRVNLAFMNTLVTRGRAELLVTATGSRTELGRLATLMEAGGDGSTPLQIQLGRLGKRLALLAGIAVAAVFGLGLLRGTELGLLLLTSLSLAVASVPEGLPAVVTVTLALGMQRMARNRAVVKRLSAVETLGCTTLICSDKTGTLTHNRMSARAVFTRGVRMPMLEPEGAGAPPAEPPPALEPLLQAVALCNDCHLREGQVLGDPTEAALLTLALGHGVDPEQLARRLPRIAEIPFDPDSRLMATFHQEESQIQLFVKGAPEALLSRCDRMLGEDGPCPLLAEAAEHPAAHHEALANQALRVLAVASKTLSVEQYRSCEPAQHLEGLAFLGLVGLMDAPKSTAREALALCRQAGIEVKMVTGDHVRTALAVAQELGFRGDVITGEELDASSPEALSERLEAIGVFARVRPEHKVAIVEAAQARGHVVAMTGDGVNDAPALRRADIGVAMGERGTEVAKEAADMVLTDDDFATIVGAVREGRTIYDNIVKFVRFQLSTNFGAVLSVLTAPLLGLPLPFHPIQILWVNIIMDGPPALALGLDPPSPEIMHRPPRGSRDPILSWRRLARLLALGSVMALGTLGVLGYALGTGSRPRALTLAFTTFVCFQIFNAFNARSERASAFGRALFHNWQLWAALAVVVALQGLAVSWAPARAVFHTAPLSAGDIGLAVGVGASILVFEELYKALRRMFS